MEQKIAAARSAFFIIFTFPPSNKFQFLHVSIPYFWRWGLYFFGDCLSGIVLGVKDGWGLGKHRILGFPIIFPNFTIILIEFAIILGIFTIIWTCTGEDFSVSNYFPGVCNYIDRVCNYPGGFYNYMDLRGRGFSHFRLFCRILQLY